jgi:hypothetical protein
MHRGLERHPARTGTVSVEEQPMTAIETQPLVSSLVDPDFVVVCLFAGLGLAVTGVFVALGFGPEIAQALAF